MTDYDPLNLDSPVRGMARYFSSPDFDDVESWSGVLYAVGYEARSAHAAELIGARCTDYLGVGFESNQVLAFDESLRAAQERGQAKVCATTAVGDEIREFVGRHVGEQGRRLAIDVSSFSRDRLAAVLWTVLESVAQSGYGDVDLLYSPAKFRQADRKREQPPVRASLIEKFEGWITDPSLPTRAIVGLGYEPGRAVGAIEFLEPSLIDFFIPVGFDERYESEVRAANDGLLSSSDAVTTVAYPLSQPYKLVARLMSTIDDRASHRPVLLPLGPKIFAAAAIVASALSEHRVPIWRISDGGASPSAPVAAEGPVVTLRMQFRSVGS